MKKVLCILLAFALMLPIAATGAVAADKCGCGITPVVYVVGFGDDLYLNAETDDAELVYPPSASAITGTLPSMVKAVWAIALNDSDSFAESAMDIMNAILSDIAMDKNGESINNIGIKRTAITDNHQIAHYRLGQFTSTEPYGEFVFNQDWRLSPADNAVLLDSFISEVKELTGHDEVSVICHSQGNNIVLSYLKEFGSDNIKKIEFLSPAFGGISLMGGLLSKEADIKGKGDQFINFVDSLMGKDMSGKLITAVLNLLKRAGLMDSLLDRAQTMLDEQFDVIFSECIVELFGTMPGVWSFVPDEYYIKAKECAFGNSGEYATLIEKIDYYHYEIQNKSSEIIADAMNNGIAVIIACGYDISTIPVTNGNPEQADMLIDTKYMSIGATCAPFGKTLGKNYVQAVDCGHDHLSADGIIDASTAAFPEITWFIKGQSHSDFPDSYLKFTDWAMLYDGQPTVFTDPAYPQFMVNDSTDIIKPVEKEEQNDTFSVLSFIKMIIEQLKAILNKIFKF